MAIKVIQYRDKCIGCNSCVEDAPYSWKISQQDGKSILIDAKETKKQVFVKEISPAELAEMKQAAEDCPMNVIRVLEK